MKNILLVCLTSLSGCSHTCLCMQGFPAIIKTFEYKYGHNFQNYVGRTLTSNVELFIIKNRFGPHQLCSERGKFFRVVYGLSPWGESKGKNTYAKRRSVKIIRKTPFPKGTKFVIDEVITGYSSVGYSCVFKGKSKDMKESAVLWVTAWIHVPDKEWKYGTQEVSLPNKFSYAK